MASKEIEKEIPTYITLYKDGTVDRPRQTPYAAPSLDGTPHVSSKDIIISQNPSISARLYLPKPLPQTHKLPILVYFHGGGFFFESAFSELYHNYFNTFVPAAYDDCFAALQWVASHSSNNTTEPWLIDYGDFSRIFIGGDSAGGNIVHNVAMRAGSEALEEGGNVNLLGAIYVHPYFYSSEAIGSESVSEHEKSLGYIVWDFVYPNAPGGINNPMVNPFAPGAPSLASLGCSKILVCLAGNDSIRDRGIWFFEGLNKSGWKGKSELFEEAGEDHVYHIFHPETEKAKKITDRMASFILH
ncbi:2-hydroxyisoflavanone dehydratase [Arachis duranensis]|uniref:2-hydroxyisoflavanone dehydratase n=1 Tax=Arachis duranensis TaxID=130453 RepID=A0A6P5NSP8_ARADU|nr:2-hydroxyisoflavanone dehydratase [Arachis duranensis]